MKIFVSVMLVIMCGLWLALTDAENRDRAATAKRQQMNAAFEKIAKECLTGEGVTLEGRIEACDFIQELRK